MVLTATDSGAEWRLTSTAVSPDSFLAGGSAKPSEAEKAISEKTRKLIFHLRGAAEAICEVSSTRTNR